MKKSVAMRHLTSKIVIMGLVCLGAGVVSAAPWLLAGQTVPPPPSPDATAKSQEKQVVIGQKPTERLPIGLAHDFGKIKYETSSSCFLGFVNLEKHPLRIVSVRASSANHLRAMMSKTELQPGEEGKLKVTIDARCFVGLKRTDVHLEMECGGKTIVSLARITAESVKDSDPGEMESGR